MGVQLASIGLNIVLISRSRDKLQSVAADIGKIILLFWA
jgi:short-subunit dehydrogenase